MLSITEIVLVVHVILLTQKRNAEVRRNEHNNPIKSSELSKHFRSYVKRYFTQTVTLNDPKNAKTRKKLKVSDIAFWKHDLKKQKDFERLVLFRNVAM